MYRNDWYHCVHSRPGTCSWFVSDKQYPKDSLRVGLSYTIEIEANSTLGKNISQYPIEPKYIGKEKKDLQLRWYFSQVLFIQ